MQMYECKMSVLSSEYSDLDHSFARNHEAHAVSSGMLMKS